MDGQNYSYCLGGPTLEMFCDSYNKTHENKIEYTIQGGYGYAIRWKSEDNSNSYNYKIDDLDPMNELYCMSSTDKAYYMWMASPNYLNWGEGNMVAGRGNTLSKATSNGVGYNYQYCPGFRPIICLSSLVKLVQLEDGSFNIS